MKSHPLLSLMASALLLGIGLLPGFPLLVFLVLAGLMSGLGYLMQEQTARRDQAEAAAEARRQSGDALCEQGRQLPYFGLAPCQTDRPERPQPRDYEPGLRERLVQRLGLSYFFPRRPNYMASGFFDVFEGLGGVFVISVLFV